MSKPNGKWSYDWNWTQPYTSMDQFFRGQSCQEIYNALSLEEEIDALDKTDEMVDKMLTYPDAEAILDKIRKDRQ